MFATHLYPLENTCQAAIRYFNSNDPSTEMRNAVYRLSVALRVIDDYKLNDMVLSIEQVISQYPVSEESQPPESTFADHRPIQPAPAGNPVVLVRLKQHYGMLENDEVPTDVIGLDQFPLRADSSLKSEHDLLTKMFDQIAETSTYGGPILESSEVGGQILAMDGRKRGLVLLAAAERSAQALLVPIHHLARQEAVPGRYAAMVALRELLSEPFEFNRESFFDFLLTLSAIPIQNRPVNPSATIADWIQEELSGDLLGEGERYVLHLFRASLVGHQVLGSSSEDVRRLTQMIGDGATFILHSGEVWSEALNSEIGKRTTEELRLWIRLILHLLSATSSRPSKHWITTAADSIKDIGRDKVKALEIRLFELVDKGRTVPPVPAGTWDTRGKGDTMQEENAICLRGFLWMVPLLDPSPELIRLVGTVGISAYRKVPGVGPRAVKVGNAAVYALSEIEGLDSVGQLARLRAKVKFGTAQKMIEKAFEVAAEREGVSRSEMDELAVPEYGLTEVGNRVETLGDFTAELTTDAIATELKWIKPDGKAQKSVPKTVKEGFGEELKELKAAAKDIQIMVSAQKERLDQLFLKRKTWPFSVWRERYLDHPLVGILSRRLFWEVENDGEKQAIIWLDDALVDLEGEAFEVEDPDAAVTLWHPFGHSTHAIMACRRFVETNRIRQPFKQAHREIYLLTEAEQNTGVYSNRFAAHIIKQHQFNALCGQRGWKNSLQLMVDDSVLPAHKLIPEYAIRAEFWANGIGEDFGTDTTDTGTFLRMSTDQVRFYPIDDPLGAGGMCYGENFGHEAANPMRLQDVPGLVFSEAMRDVDLFVGVASVGNDPTWADGGPEGQHRDYWHSYSFGDLNETAKTRHGILEGLVPQLKIAERCTLTDKFLVVRGDVRTYKIHLGSGNILMEPDDQYLCIVAGRSQTDKSTGKVFLPFEGDNMLSIILSKAMMLAEDRKIADRTILNQIRKRGLSV